MVGAGGTTASTRAKRAPPDGYTIVMGHMGTHAASVALYPNLAYKPDVDFEPIGMAAGTPVLILAKKDFPPKDLKEFVTYVKANDDKLNMAHAGVGSVSFTHLPAAQPHLGVKPTSIPYNGTGPAHERAGRRPSRLHVRPDRQRRAAGQGRHHQGLCDRHRRTQSGAAGRADHQGGRAAGVPGVGLERAVRAQGHAKADPRQASATRSTRRSTTRATRKRLLDLGSDIPGKDRRGQQALAALVKSEIARWTPIIKAVGPTDTRLV